MNVVEYFNHESEKFNAQYTSKPTFQERLKIFSAEIEHVFQEKVKPSCLDLGCGSGVLTEVITAHGGNAIAIDQSEEMLNLAKDRLEKAGYADKVQWICASLPLQSDLINTKVDLAVSSSVLEYVPEIDRAILSIAERIIRGGKFVFSVPNKDSLYRIMQRFLKKLGLLKNSYIQHQHHQFSKGELANQLKRAGFKIRSERYFALPTNKLLQKTLKIFPKRLSATMILIVAIKES